MADLSAILAPYQIPKIVKVKETFNNDLLADVEGEVLKGLKANCKKINKGDRIAITCGSRGIDHYIDILKVIVNYVKEQGGQPILIPAMGSHGGATAEGQKEVLKGYGVTEESIGAPILSSMEVVELGKTDKGLPVYIDKNAYECDGIILFNRVKLHTSFRGKYESGLVKMLAIGLAKQKGAQMTHFLMFENMAENIVRVGTIGLDKLNIMCGVCTVENGYNHVAEVHVLKKDEILEKEPQILKDSARRMPRIALDQIDVLVISEIGKEISGTGMDTNIIGRYHTKAATGGPKITRIGVLNATAKSEGNANGMGLADFMPDHMWKQVDLNATYANTLTSTEPTSSKIPMILKNDEEVFKGCIKCSGRVNSDDVKMVIIRSTKYLDEVYMSEAAVKAAVEPIEVVGDYFEVPFDKDRNLNLFEKH